MGLGITKQILGTQIQPICPGLTLFFYFLKGRMTYCSFFKKKGLQMICFLQNLVAKKNYFNLFFYSKHHDKHIYIFLKKSRNNLKNKINPNLKIFSRSYLSPYARRRGKGTQVKLPLMKWNPLTRYRSFLWLEESSMMTLSLSTSEFSKSLSPSKK